jgi:hypothetical protein
MKRAGWTLADDLSIKSVWHMVRFTITRKSYKAAPVSSLYLFGRKQDFAYQQEVKGSPSRRHHVRFWKCPAGWVLPGGYKATWLAAGTYDKSVGLSWYTFQFTHKIAEKTDEERDHIVRSLREGSSNNVTVKLIKNYSTGYHHRNGGGDSIKTDGDLPIITIT